MLGHVSDTAWSTRCRLLIVVWGLVFSFHVGAENTLSDVADGGYEVPMCLTASDILPAYLLTGDSFSVDLAVRNDGETNFYVVRSPHGTLEAAGRNELNVAIQELRAMALLKDTRMRQGAIVGVNQGMRWIVAKRYRYVKRVVFNPLYAIKAVPHEISTYVAKAATVQKVFRDGPKAYLRRNLGIDRARDMLAERLHVDANTENELLAAEIRRVGWGVYAGTMIPRIADEALDIKIDLETQVGDYGTANLGKVVKALEHGMPRRSARRLLKRCDVPKDLNKAFRANPNYTRRMQVGVARALILLKEAEDRAAFIRWAMTMAGKHQATQAVRLAQVMSIYNHIEEPIVALYSNDQFLVFKTESGRMVLPMQYDYLLWTKSAALRLAETATWAESKTACETIAIWSTGEFSPRANAALTALGYDVHSNVETEFPVYRDRKRGLGWLKQKYEQHVEEPVRWNRLPDRRHRLVLEPLGPS